MAELKLRLGEGEKLLDSLLRRGVELAHDCGGMLACTTCRVIVREGQENLSEVSEDERDMLDRAASFEPGARLACQAFGNQGDLVIEIPQDEALRIAAPLRGIARPIVLSA